MKTNQTRSGFLSRRARGAVFAGITLAFAICGAGTVQAEAATIDVPEGVYTITSSLTGKALDIQDANTSNGGNVQVWDGERTFDQYWRVEKVGEHYSIKNSLTGVALDVNGAGTSDGTNAQVYESNGTAAQLWDFVQNEDGSITIQSALKKDFVLDVAGANTSNGANVQLYGSNGTAAQKWSMSQLEQTLESGTYSITSALKTSKSLDVISGSTDNGAGIQLYSSNGTLAQKWGLTYNASTGFYTIDVGCSGKALDIPGGNPSSGVRVQQYANNGTAAQCWSIVKNEDGTYSIVSVLSGLVLDAESGSYTNGTRVQMYSSNGTNAQKWYISETALSGLDGIYQVTSSLSDDAVIDVSGGSKEANAKIQAWSSNKTLAQTWKLSVVGDGGTYYIKNANSGRYLLDSGSGLSSSSSVDSDALDDSCLWEAGIGNGGLTFTNVATGKVIDLSGANTNSGTKVSTYAPNGTAAQAWLLKSTSLVSEGCYALYNTAGSSQVLDVPSGSTDSGVALQTYGWNDTGAQKWYVRSAGNGWYTITNAQSGKALDVRNGSTTSGATVQQYESNGSDAQLWTFDVAPSGGVSVTSKLGNLALSTKDAKVVNGTGVDVETLTSASNATFSWNFTATSYQASSTGTVKSVDVQKVANGYSTVNVRMKNGTTKSFTCWCGANTFTGTFKVEHTAYALDKNPTADGGDARYVNGYWVCYCTCWQSYPDDPNRSRMGCDQGTHSNEYDEGQGFHFGEPGGSKGCILFPDMDDAEEFYELMKENIGVEVVIY